MLDNEIFLLDSEISSFSRSLPAHPSKGANSSNSLRLRARIFHLILDEIKHNLFIETSEAKKIIFRISFRRTTVVFTIDEHEENSEREMKDEKKFMFLLKGQKIIKVS